MLRIVVSLLSIVALCFWIANVWGAIILYWKAGGGPLPAYYLYYAIYPVIYLLFLLASCSRILCGSLLVGMGLVLHAALVVWIIVDIRHRSMVTTQTSGFAVLMAALWFVMCIGRLNKKWLTRRDPD